MAVVSFLLAGVENVGVQIEEPHRVLPLNQMCAGTLRALRAMMEDRQGACEMADITPVGKPLPPPKVAGSAACDPEGTATAMFVPSVQRQATGCSNGEVALLQLELQTAAQFASH